MSINKQERNKKICELYNKNMLIKEIAVKLSIDRHTVTRVLKKYNIYDKNKQKHKINQERIERNEKIISLYNKGYSFSELANIFNIGHTTIEYVIHQFIDDCPIQYNIHIDDKNDLIRHRKHNFNVNFFETIDTEEKAYWLGFLYADGCITDRSVRLELQKSDESHIKNFQKAIGALDINLYHRKDIESSLLCLNSVKMVKDLQKLGCIKNKTFLLQFPDNNKVPEKLINHFMRGYFDGDGCICVTSKTKVFQVTGLNTFLDVYENILLNHCGNQNRAKRYAYKNNNGIESFIYSGKNRLTDIYNFLYNNANIFLERKKKKFELIVKPS